MTALPTVYLTTEDGKTCLRDAEGRKLPGVTAFTLTQIAQDGNIPVATITTMARVVFSAPEVAPK